MAEMTQLESWLAQEREVRARLEAGAGIGVARPEQVAGKSGLQIMSAILQGELPFAPIGQTLDFVLVEVGEGRAVFQGTPGPAHLNPLGTIHGGWYATLQVPRTRSEEQWCLDLLEGDGVLVQPGFFYDFESEAYLVLSLLTPADTFREGVKRVLRRL